MKFREGQEVWYIRKERGGKEADRHRVRVDKVGRKWVTATIYGQGRQFDGETGAEKSQYYAIEWIKTDEMLEDEERRKRVIDYFRSYRLMDYVAPPKISPEHQEKVMELLIELGYPEP